MAVLEPFAQSVHPRRCSWMHMAWEVKKQAMQCQKEQRTPGQQASEGHTRVKGIPE